MVVENPAKLATANEPVGVGRILPEIEAEMARLLFLDHLARRVLHLGFHAAAADG
jgi:hypothetical protein